MWSHESGDGADPVGVDLATRMVVGWQLAEHMRTSLVIDALQMAITHGHIRPGAVFHSDRGAQYTSTTFNAFCVGERVRTSLGRTGVCWDNAAVESFFAALKTEMYHRETFTTRARARFAVANYIEVLSGYAGDLGVVRHVIAGPIYTAVSEQAALDAFAEFSGKWERKYPAITRLWTNAWAEMVPFLRFDVEIRRIICSTNAIESLNARLRRAVNARGHFPTEQAALKVLYLAITSLDPTGRGRARWSNRWKAALNAFDITFDGRVTAGRR